MFNAPFPVGMVCKDMTSQPFPTQYCHFCKDKLANRCCCDQNKIKMILILMHKYLQLENVMLTSVVAMVCASTLCCRHSWTIIVECAMFSIFNLISNHGTSTWCIGCLIKKNYHITLNQLMGWDRSGVLEYLQYQF